MGSIEERIVKKKGKMRVKLRKKNESDTKITVLGVILE